MLDQTTPKLNIWDLAIQAVYPKGSSGYTNLFPQGHKRFRRGTRDDRMNAFHALDTALTGIVALAATKTDVHNFYSALLGANNAQGTQKGNTQTDSTAVEAGRIAICTSLLSLYGSLLNKFAATPAVISDYMELSEMGNQPQTAFMNNHQPELSIHHIVKRTLADTMQISIANNGNGTLQFYLSDQPNGAVGAQFVNCLPHTTSIHNIAEFGDESLLHFLNVFNTSNLAVGSWIIHIL